MSDTWRRTEWAPAFDRRDPDPKKNYGIHGVEVRFLVGNEDGVVQFLLYTNWMLKHVQEEHREQYGHHVLMAPLPADLGYHSPTPKYEGHGSMGPCPYLNGRECYYDGSGLNAERIYWLLVEKGDEAMWKELEAYHAKLFDHERRTSHE
jgi:hypothetical protein